MIKRIIIAILCLVLGFGVASAIFPQTSENAGPSPVEEILAPSPAEAVIGFAYVANESPRDIKIACSYGGTLIVLHPNQQSMQAGKCTKSRSDTDQIKVYTTSIMLFQGPVKADGCYRIAPDHRKKVPDLSYTVIYSLASGCHGKSYKGYWTYD